MSWTDGLSTEELRRAAAEEGRQARDVRLTVAKWGFKTLSPILGLAVRRQDEAQRASEQRR